MNKQFPSISSVPLQPVSSVFLEVSKQSQMFVCNTKKY